MTRFLAPHFSDASYKEMLAAITAAGYKPLRVDEAERLSPMNISMEGGGGMIHLH